MSLKIILSKKELEELSENKNARNADQIAREMKERARKILKDEPVESCRMRINFY